MPIPKQQQKVDKHTKYSKMEDDEEEIDKSSSDLDWIDTGSEEDDVYQKPNDSFEQEEDQFSPSPPANPQIRLKDLPKARGSNVPATKEETLRRLFSDAEDDDDKGAGFLMYSKWDNRPANHPSDEVSMVSSLFTSSGVESQVQAPTSHANAAALVKPDGTASNDSTDPEESASDLTPTTGKKKKPRRCALSFAPSWMKCTMISLLIIMFVALMLLGAAILLRYLEEEGEEVKTHSNYDSDNNNNPFIWSKRRPTSMPSTIVVTAEPTTTPTTEMPSLRPTTETPTATPTRGPTIRPTMAPSTSSPSSSPVVDTLSPTRDSSPPVRSPTLAPTVATTIAQTVAPTVSPTLAPTVAPTVAPTLAPTLAPRTTLSPSSIATTQAPSRAKFVPKFTATTQPVTATTPTTTEEPILFSVPTPAPSLSTSYPTTEMPSGELSDSPSTLEPSQVPTEYVWLGPAFPWEPTYMDDWKDWKEQQKKDKNK